MDWKIMHEEEKPPHPRNRNVLGENSWMQDERTEEEDSDLRIYIRNRKRCRYKSYREELEDYFSFRIKSIKLIQNLKISSK